jgi:hypothetical protein
MVVIHGMVFIVEAYSFNGNGDHVLRFTSLDNYDGNCVLTLMAFVPAILSVENGSLEERLG